MDVAMIDDRMLPVTDLPKPYLDRGVYFGDGVYEVVRSYHGVIFELDEHLSRFQRSLREIQIANVDIEEIRQKILTAYEKGGYDNAKIYFHITRGSETRDHLPSKDIRPNFLLTLSELHDKPQDKEKGIAVTTHPDWRWKRCDIKSLNLLPNVLARIEANKRGASEAILIGDDGTITEGAGSAFFAIKDGCLVTRPLGHEILPSITRSVVLKVAQAAEIPVCEESLTSVQAAACQELFIAVTTKDIVPIAKFDDQPAGSIGPGPLTLKLMQHFQEFVKTYTSK